jgi:hypothetical protein
MGTSFSASTLYGAPHITIYFPEENKALPQSILPLSSGLPFLTAMVYFLVFYMPQNWTKVFAQLLEVFFTKHQTGDEVIWKYQPNPGDSMRRFSGKRILTNT